MPRYKLTIAYDGTGFHGWQRQFVSARVEGEEGVGGEGAERGGGDGLPESGGDESTGGTPVPPVEKNAGRAELRTVQGVVESAVRQIVREPVTLFGASRTDAGVHAKGQVAAFTTGREGGRGGRGWPPERGTEPLLRAINSRLPADVLVLSCEEVDVHFDPIRASSKSYSYTFHTGAMRPLFGRQYVYHVRVPVDAERMDAAAAAFVGEHDFAAFAATGHGRLTTVRTIYTCSVRRVEEDRVVMEVSGNGFLWNMVRIIGGTLLEIGTGRRPVEDVARIIASADRRQAGATLPPNGLCLEWIRYGEGDAGAGVRGDEEGEDVE